MGRYHNRIYKEFKQDFLAEVDGQEVITWTTGARSVALDRVTVSDWLVQDPETRSAIPRGGKFDQLRLDLESRIVRLLLLRTTVTRLRLVLLWLGTWAPRWVLSTVVSVVLSLVRW